MVLIMRHLQKNTLVLLLTGIGLTIFPENAYAGMPTFVLSDVAALRLSTISFFLLVYLGSSFGVFRLWNWLRQDFQKLPELSFKKAMALVLIWGLAFHLLLVMIAGTRGLITPQAWEKAGIVYQLSPDAFEEFVEIRRHKMEPLKKELWNFAEKHSDKFPLKQELLSISPNILLEPGGKMSYNYVEGLSIKSPSLILAYEPDTYGQERMTLLTNGNIELLPLKAIKKMMRVTK